MLSLVSRLSPLGLGSVIADWRREHKLALALWGLARWGHAVAAEGEILTAMVFVSEKWRGKLCNGPALSGEWRG